MRIIDMTAEDLRDLVASEVATQLRNFRGAKKSNIIGGRKNIATALGISVDKLDQLINDGYLSGAVKKNGRTIICDISKAFECFADEWN